MPAKIYLKIKKDGVRGTENASKVIEMLTQNWTQFRDNFNSLEKEERDELFGHFEAFMENLGDILFGPDSNAEDMERFVHARQDTE